MCWPNTTPISALPVKLLAHIFSLTTHCSSDIEDNVTAPLALSSISRRWPDVALSMSRLWTSICLTTDDVLSLPSLLSDPLTPSEGGLHTLELAYHACGIRASASEFLTILSRPQGLKSLVLNIYRPNLSESNHNAQTPL
jgi:hypothetical protein